MSKIKFGHLEKVISEMKDIRIFSIIGKQSLEKCNLINRLFGTRFDTTSCEGI